MTSNLMKLAILTGGLTTSGIIGGSTYYLINKKNLKTAELKTISDWLSEDNKVLLGTDDSEWAGKWASFKETYPKSNPPRGVWAFSNWNVDFDGNGEELKTKCKTQSTEKIESKLGELYEAVKKYCTKDKPLSPRQ